LTLEEIKAAPKVKPEVAVPTGVTVFELFTPGRARTTVLVWIVSFGFLWASNGILFMLPTILTQRGIPLTDAIAFQLVQAIGGFFGYSSCSFLIDRYGRRPVLFLYYFVGAFFHLAFAMSTGFATYVTAFLVGWVNPGVYGATSVYVGELHPPICGPRLSAGFSASGASALSWRPRWSALCSLTGSAAGPFIRLLSPI
jgi:putative MFS transporter